MRSREVYQSFCSVCGQPLEGESPDAAIRRTLEHEAEMEVGVIMGRNDPKTHEPIKDGEYNVGREVSQSHFSFSDLFYGERS